MWKSIKKWWHTVPFTSHPKFLTIVGLLLIIAAIPFTVFVAQQQQDIRQQATSCSTQQRAYDSCYYNLYNPCYNSNRESCMTRCKSEGKTFLTCNDACGKPSGDACQVVAASSCQNEKAILVSCLSGSSNPTTAPTPASITTCGQAAIEACGSLTCIIENGRARCVGSNTCAAAGGTCADEGCSSAYTLDASKSCGNSSAVCCIKKPPTPTPTPNTTCGEAARIACGSQACILDSNGRARCVNPNTCEAIGGSCNDEGCTSDKTVDSSKSCRGGNEVCCVKKASQTQAITCPHEGKNYNPGDKVYKCANPRTRGSGDNKCDTNAGLGAPRICNANGQWSYPNEAGECTRECATSSSNPPSAGNGGPAESSRPSGGGGSNNGGSNNGGSNAGGPNESKDEKPTATPKPKKDEPALDCEPGTPVDDCSVKCKNGGTCKQAHKFCVWDDDGTNYASACICDSEKLFCEKSASSSSSGSCKDNPVDPPKGGYTWKRSCDKKCSNNDQCPKNTKEEAVNPENSNWCYEGTCMMLVTSGDSSSRSSSKSSKDREKEQREKEKKEKEKKKKAEEKRKKEKEKKIQDSKSDRDKAQKAVDKLNKDRKNQGLPTLTPLPPDWDPKKITPTVTGGPTPTPTGGPTPTISPTPLPPLAEPANWQGFCAQTTNPQKPWGIRVSWDAVPGATRYAVRIDEDAPSWEGDTPSPGDTVDNQVTTPVYVRQAKPGAVYQWWVHSVNANGVYSGLSKKLIIKCPNPSTTTGTPPPQTVGAGQLIVLP